MYNCLIYLRNNPIIKVLFASILMVILATQSVSAQTIDSNHVSKIIPEQTGIVGKVICLDILPEVKLQSFYFNKTWQDLPAPVARLESKQLEEIATTSLLPGLNTVPGIRMEQRSPESFRLSMRGSVLRSPFGVRDLKVYWNGLPISDGGGNTYLNLINTTQISSLEVIKGNTASMYGAGIGGVLLLNTNNFTNPYNKNSYNANVDGGSFGLFEESASWQYQNGKFGGKLVQSHEQSDGYRQQSASRKDNVTYTASYNTQKNKLDLITFYTSQYYQTPGGLTLAQMQQNPTLARTAGGGYPGAVQQKAAIYNNTPFIGLHDVYSINQFFSTDVAVVYNHTAFTNPYITDYETRSETNLNANSKLIYKHSIGNAKLQWINGGEILGNHAIIEDDGNLNGARDTVQYKDNVFIDQWFAFSQAQLDYNNWTFQLGGSANSENFRYKRLTDGSLGYTHKNTNVAAMPRATIGYNFNNKFTIFGDVSRGFSPPALAEIRPSNRVFNTTLQPESGWGEEVGIKGGMFHRLLTFDVDLYRMRLENAIVSRNNANGTAYYVNAGNTKQDGVEVYLKYHIYQSNNSAINAISVSNSYSYQPYKFITYQQGNTNYSGNHLTGVPHNVNVTGVEVTAKKGFYLHVFYTYTSSIPLTDANDAYANAYHLLQTKGGWKTWYKKLSIDIYIGGDNLLNEHYSLGDDINAAGKRFYNPAATINFFGGCKVGW
jgi:iron complex outermembrane receptor protein